MRSTWKSLAQRLPAYLLLSAGLLATLAAALLAKHLIRDEYTHRLAVISDQIRNRIVSRIEKYENALTQTRSFMMTASPVDRAHFRQYVGGLQILEKYPGNQGFGYTVRLKNSELAPHIARVRREGFPHYRVWPETPREEYFSIIYLEPFDWRNQRAFGFDMFTEPARQEAMERARDTGAAAMSNIVKLVQETEEDVQPGFLIYVPVFKNGIVPSTVEGRREALSGFVYSPFRANDLFDAIFRSELSTYKDVNVEIYDGRISAETQLYDSGSRFGEARREVGRIVEDRLAKVAGRDWHVLIAPRPTFYTGLQRFAPFGIGAAGTLLSFLVVILVGASRRHLKREQASRETLEQINRISKSISAELKLEKLVQDVTDAATGLAGAEFGAFFYNVVDSQGESYTLYTISGVPRAMFEKFPMPRNTEVFAPTFTGTSTVRSDDITQDPRYGKNKPYYGMPKGHLPVRSYLAVPVVSRLGVVLGGLFFGHSRPGVFGPREEAIVAGIASHAAVAIDNSKLYEKTQAAVKARDEFLSICSHELKTPVTSLKLQAQITRRKVDKGGNLDQEQLKKMCETMDQQLDQLTRLIDDMLDVARIETGRVALAREHTDLATIVNDTVSRFLPQTRTHGVELNVTAPRPVPVFADPDRISQVVRNLLSNGLKYGQGKPIWISVRQEGDRAVLTVRDEGLGISDQDQKRIFERFERVIPHQHISGLGLGLFISRQIAEAHGGHIKVESRLSEGSLFTVELPLDPEGGAGQA